MAKKPQGNRKPHPVQRKGIPSGWVVVGGIAVAAVLVLALVWSTLAPRHSYGGRPQLQVSTERLELGKQIFGHTIRASFTVKNTGTGTLTLSAPSRPTVLQGCCPAALVVEQTILDPGQSTLVYTDLMMHEGMGGPHLFEIPLTTNDPTQPVKNLLIVSDWQPS